MRAAIYARHKLKNEVKGQIKACMKYAEKHELVVNQNNIYADTVSANSPIKPGLDNLLIEASMVGLK